VRKFLDHFFIGIVGDVESLCGALGSLSGAAGFNPVFFQRQNRPVKTHEKQYK